jgi:hypothetical protein
VQLSRGEFDRVVALSTSSDPPPPSAKRWRRFISVHLYGFARNETSEASAAAVTSPVSDVGVSHSLAHFAERSQSAARAQIGGFRLARGLLPTRWKSRWAHHHHGTASKPRPPTPEATGVLTLCPCLIPKLTYISSEFGQPSRADDGLVQLWIMRRLRPEGETI